MKNRRPLAAVASILFAGLAGLLAAPAAQAEVAKPTVVLVHGGFVDASSWTPVIRGLKKAGYPVVAVQNNVLSLKGDLEATQRAIDAAPGPVTLVGHSWGGVVITEAGVADKVKSLVYVAAFAPAPQESVIDLAKDYPAPGLANLQNAGGYLTLPAADLRAHFGQDLPQATVDLLVSTQAAVPGQVLGEKVSAAAWQAKPSWYVKTTQDHMILPALQDRMAQRIRAQVSTVNASHLAILSQPQAVVKAIVAASQ